MRSPLGLPPGSVRAFLALAVVLVSCLLMVRSEESPLAVSEALFTVMAYYFATRARVTLTRDELARLLAERGQAPEEHPLFLPRGTVRVLFVVAFLGVAAWVVREGGWRGLLSATTLLFILAFFAGQALKHGLWWLRRNRMRTEAGLFEDLKALVGIAVGAAFVGLFVSGYHRTSPQQVHKAFLGFIIFYFGSR